MTEEEGRVMTDNEFKYTLIMGQEFGLEQIIFIDETNDKRLMAFGVDKDDAWREFYARAEQFGIELPPLLRGGDDD